MFVSQQSDRLLDLGYLTLGAVILAIGLVALLISILRRERRDSTVIFFGCLSALAGLRFLINTSVIPLILGGSPGIWDTGRAALAYLLAVSAFAFTRSYLGPCWRQSLSWASWGYFVFACMAILSLLLLPNREFFAVTNRLVIIIVLSAIFANCVRPKLRKNRGAQIIAVFSMTGIMYFILESLRSLNLISLNIHTEWARMTIFHVTLVALVLAVRFVLIREERLAAVRQELSVARRIQASILPRTTPAVSGLDIACCYEPMTEVAGDFYGFVTMGPSRLGVLVADVSGHGVPAALIGSMVKVAFQAQTDRAHEPARVLAGLNRIFGGQLGSQFITAGYAFIDMETRQLHYSGAAHPPLLIRPADGGDIVCLQENGLMLGPFPDAAYGSISHDLVPGDRIVMCTDGLTEAANSDDEQFGEERLHRFLARSAEQTATDFAADLLADVTTWEGRRRGDDLTLVVIDILAE